MGTVLEFLSLLFLGVLLTLAITHLINGTFTQWVSSKFGTQDA
jgi:hypothetical protein